MDCRWGAALAGTALIFMLPVFHPSPVVPESHPRRESFSRFLAAERPPEQVNSSRFCTSPKDEAGSHG